MELLTEYKGRTESDVDIRSLPPLELPDISPSKKSPAQGVLGALQRFSISQKSPKKKDLESNTLSPTLRRHNELADRYNVKEKSAAKTSPDANVEEKEVYVDLSSKGFPGFAVQFDSNKYLYTEQIVLEMLKELGEKSPTGTRLLAGIQAATPTYRDGFKSGVNITFIPQKRVGAVPDLRVIGVTTPSGKADFLVRPSEVPLGNKTTTGDSAEKGEASDTAQENLIHRGSSANAAKNLTAATTPGQGSVCELGFTNTQVTVTHELGNGDGPKNEFVPPVIVFAHELIHALRCLSGESLSGKGEGAMIGGNLVTLEEQFTVGIGEGADAEITENAIRREMGLPERTTYGPPKKVVDREVDS